MLVAIIPNSSQSSRSLMTVVRISIGMVTLPYLFIVMIFLSMFIATRFKVTKCYCKCFFRISNLCNRVSISWLTFWLVILAYICVILILVFLNSLLTVSIKAPLDNSTVMVLSCSPTRCWCCLFSPSSSNTRSRWWTWYSTLSAERYHACGCVAGTLECACRRLCNAGTCLLFCCVPLSWLGMHLFKKFHQCFLFDTDTEIDVFQLGGSDITVRLYQFLVTQFTSTQILSTVMLICCASILVSKVRLCLMSHGRKGTSILQLNYLISPSTVKGASMADCR